MTVALLCAALLSVTACGGGSPGTVVFVTVSARPTVQPSATLRVSVANAGGTVSQDFTIAGESFPRTFTVTPTGRAGDLTVTVTALGDDLTPRAVGSAAAPIVPDEQTDLAVQLEPTDFLVNEGVVRTQWLTFREELAGRQVAAAADGSFLVAWENDCPLTRCDILARMFAPNTVPTQNGSTMTAGDFIVNQASTYTESPAIAASDDGFLMAWIYEVDMVTLTRNITATVLAADGAHAAPFDILVSSSAENEGAPAAFTREDGSYVVLWQRDRVAPATGTEIRARLISAAGTPTVNPLTGDDSDFRVASATTGVQSLPYGIGLPGGGFVVAWTQRNDAESVTNVRARVFDASGQPTTLLDVPITSYTGTATAYGTHVAATPDGFVVGWQVYDFSEPRFTMQPLLLRRFAPGGAALSTEIQIAARTIPFTAMPSLAVTPSGAMGAAWSDCAENGDGAGCGIRFRLFYPNGLPAGDSIVVNTTTPNDQLSPTVVALGADAFLLAWTDGSLTPPDTDGSGVRARVIYPTLDHRDGAIGALCGGAADAACGMDLACAATPQGPERCQTVCTTTCPGGGVCQSGVCQFQ